jgi:MFS family permease
MQTIQLPVTQLDRAAWIVIGYLLGYTLALPLMGRVSDVYGHSRIYIVSLAVFAIGSIIVALAQNLTWLVAARVIQAIGGGALVPIAMAIAGDLYGGRSRALAIGVVGAAAEAGAAFGPFYGAAIAQFWGWQWIFWINIPVSLAIVLVVARYLRPSVRIPGKVAYLDGLILAAALTLFTLGISRQSGQPGFLAYLLGFVAASFVFFALFVWRTLRTPQPLFQFSMFRQHNFAVANLVNLLVGAALIVTMVNVPLMSDTILGTSPIEGGLRLLRFTIMLSIGALIGGLMTKRFGYRVPTISGLVLSAAGLFLMGRWSLTIADPSLSVHLALAGLGFGLVIAPLGTAVLDSVREVQKGIASSLVVMMRMVGMMIGLAAVTAWGMDRFHLMTAGISLPEILDAPETLTQTLLGLFSGFFFAAMGICLVAIVPALWLGRKGR